MIRRFVLVFVKLCFTVSLSCYNSYGHIKQLFVIDYVSLVYSVVLVCYVKAIKLYT